MDINLLLTSNVLNRTRADGNQEREKVVSVCIYFIIFKQKIFQTTKKNEKWIKHQMVIISNYGTDFCEFIYFYTFINHVLKVNFRFFFLLYPYLFFNQACIYLVILSNTLTFCQYRSWLLQLIQSSVPLINFARAKTKTNENR